MPVSAPSAEDGSAAVDAQLSGTDDNDLVITVRGEIDLANTDDLLQRLIVLAHPGSGSFALDLSQVGFMDCAGLRMLAAIDRHIQVRSGSLRITAASPEVARLFALIGPIVASPHAYVPRRSSVGIVRTHLPLSKRRPPSAPARARPR
jgi:anti-anti-sigma factor